MGRIRWKYTVSCWNRDQIFNATRNPDWQRFRRSLKGLQTKVKLQRLELYLTQGVTEARQIRVDNYINALKRGGFLNMDLEIVK